MIPLQGFTSLHNLLVKRTLIEAIRGREGGALLSHKSLAKLRCSFLMDSPRDHGVDYLVFRIRLKLQSTITNGRLIAEDFNGNFDGNL